MDNRTPEQERFLGRNQHIIVLAVLPDNDLLCTDTDAQCDHAGHVIREWGPYILTRDAKLQSVNYHYRYYHSHCIFVMGEHRPARDQRNRQGPAIPPRL